MALGLVAGGTALRDHADRTAVCRLLFCDRQVCTVAVRTGSPEPQRSERPQQSGHQGAGAAWQRAAVSGGGLVAGNRPPRLRAPLFREHGGDSLRDPAHQAGVDRVGARWHDSGEIARWE